jgi:hypothetical protein
VRRCWLGGIVERRVVVADEEAIVLQAFQQAARQELIPARCERAVDLAMENAVAAVDEAARVAVGGGLALDAGRRRGFGQ